MKTPKPMEGTWTLVAPNGNRYHADTPLKCCRSEQEDRVPEEVRQQRIVDFVESLENDDLENHPKFEAFIRAFWRRIEIYKDDYSKELPEKIPVEFRASMATAITLLDR